MCNNEKEQKPYVFFSLRDFKRDGGDTIRMYGVLNALAKKNQPVIFFSNACNYSNFHPSIKHVFLNISFTNNEKAIFQGIAALLPVFFVNLFFHRKLTKIKHKLKEIDNLDTVYFFEYIDNTIGFLLKKNNLIERFFNDVHGVATIEFRNKYNRVKNIFNKMVLYAKFLTAHILDKKVFETADGFIFPSNKLMEYFESLYNISSSKKLILPNLLASSEENVIQNDLAQEITNIYQLESKFVILFIGAFKATAGVDDLIVAFNKLHHLHQDAILLLIGEGISKKRCQNIVSQYNIQNQVFFINKIPYSFVKTYQSIADVIVCPDQMNEYSDLIVHLKYFDALASGKLVINGSFSSVIEINPNDSLSLTFTPSDPIDLFKKLQLCYEDKNRLIDKYKNTQEYVLNNLTYEAFIDDIISG